VRIKCHVCTDYDLCVQCFSDGASSHNHDPRTHAFHVIEQNSFPIYDKDWGADEELLLLEGAEIYGLGSWADIADHIGGYREKDEVRDHYIKTYIESSKFPLPEHASPYDMTLQEENPREEFQAKKKRRIEKRKDEAKNAPPATPKQKPTASVPACHEVQGYMPGRLEFETEYANEAEEAVQHMQFDPGDGMNPRTNEMEPEMELKMTVMEIYNTRLTQRAERKKVIFEHNLLEYRKNMALDKKRSKEERDLLNKAKPFARMMNKDDFDELCAGLINELNLRQAVSQLQEWRHMSIASLKEGEKYEQEKIARQQKQQPMGSLDRERFATSQRSKNSAPQADTPSGAALLVAPGLPIRLPHGGVFNVNTPTGSPKPNGVNANGHATNGALTPINGNSASASASATNGLSTLPKRAPPVIAPLSGVTPWSTSYVSELTDAHLLTAEERELCRVTRLHPKAYLVMKEHVMKEALKGDGRLKRKQVKEICKVESQKGGRLFECFVGWGGIGTA
jgi:transcriptional adapter 2-alpha